jgi:hypothetical protein
MVCACREEHTTHDTCDMATEGYCPAPDNAVMWVQVTANDLVNSNGQVGTLPTGVQFSLMTGNIQGFSVESSQSIPIDGNGGRKLLGPHAGTMLRGQVRN